MRSIRSVFLIVIVIAALLVGLADPAVAGGDRCTDCPTSSGSGGVAGGGVFATVGVSTGFVVFGGGDGCTYWAVDVGLPVGEGDTFEFGSTGHSELRYVSCDGPGDIPFEYPENAPCRAWFMTSSAGQVDANGVPDRISVYATIIWDISFVSNAGGGDSDWFLYDVLAERDEVAVAEIQSVIVD